MKPSRKLGLGAFLLGTVAAAGISIASIDSASAQSPVAAVAAVAAAAPTDPSTPASTDASSTTDSSGTDAATSNERPARGEETPLTGDDATKVEAAVKAAYPDATIDRMETDADGGVFEAHITQADGTKATVILDANYTVTDTQTGGPGGKGGKGGPHSANGITETVLTGDDATKVEAAVKAAQPDATIDRMETDADGDAFEAHVTLADGSHATVKLDANYTVTSTETGGPGGGGHGRGPKGAPADSTNTSNSTDTSATTG